eukprot:3551428-Pleurochrysis_carterae.AAC.1
MRMGFLRRRVRTGAFAVSRACWVRVLGVRSGGAMMSRSRFDETREGMAAVAGAGGGESTALVVSDIPIVQAIPIDQGADIGAGAKTAVEQNDRRSPTGRHYFPTPCHKS